MFQVLEKWIQPETRRQGRTGQRWPSCVGLLAVLTVLVTGCTAGHHRRKVDEKAYATITTKQKQALNRTEEFSIDRPSDTLRRRLLLDQRLPFSGPASMGTAFLKPVPHWPEPVPAFTTNKSEGSAVNPDQVQPLRLSLNDALQVAAANAREYQEQKEEVFSAALELDLEREEFRTSFAGLLTGAFRHDRSELGTPGGTVNEEVEVSAEGEATRNFLNGSAFSLRLGWNLLQLLEPSRFTSRSMFGDASISIPLLRGAGRHIAAEPLLQAERDALYAIYDFEEFKRGFAVDVASEYLDVLERLNQVDNAEENYRGLIASSRRARRLLDAGDIPPIQVDQALQEELSARNRWISARESYTATLDSFKELLGLPPDAVVELDPAEFEKLAAATQRIAAASAGPDRDETIPPADAPIELKVPSPVGAGPFELDPEQAIRLALEHRLDLRAVEGEIFDAQRGVVVAADQLKAEVTLFGSARLDADTVRNVRFNRGDYEALLSIDLPLERTAEAIGYRESLIELEQAVRALQALEDEIKLGIRQQLRTLREARESLQIQALSVELARRRVRGADLNLQAGRVEIRDLLEAREDLLSAQNAYTAAAVDYRLAELELQRDLGVLQVGPNGLWTEFTPQSKSTEDIP